MPPRRIVSLWFPRLGAERLMRGAGRQCCDQVMRSTKRHGQPGHARRGGTRTDAAGIGTLAACCPQDRRGYGQWPCPAGPPADRGCDGHVTRALARRFGTGLVRRLDQALGVEAEPVSPSRPPLHFAMRLTLPDPIGLAEDIMAAIDRLLPALSERLVAKGRGARRIRLQLFRSDQAMQEFDLGLARPSHGGVVSGGGSVRANSGDGRPGG